MAETDDRYRQSSNSKGEGKNRNMDTGSSNTSQRPETTTRASQSFRQASSKEHPGLSRQNHSTLGNALPHNAHSKNPLRRPHYSLAGNTASQTHSPSYVDPKYYELNPRYRKGETEPVWGLAKPLPRVVRPGMRKGRQQGEEVVEDKNAEREEPGGSEPIPQVGMVGDQRAEAGMERIDDEASENRGYGHQREEMRRQTSYRRGSRYGRGQVQSRDTARRVASAVSITERMGTPKDEKSDPIDELGATLPSQSSNTNPFEDNKTPSRRLVSTSTVAFDFASPTNDDYDLDLEAGENIDDWSLEKDEAEHYIQEERDTFNRWASIRAKFREPLAECLATMVAVLIGIAANLAVQTSNNTSGDYQSTNWAWGLGVMIGVYIAGGISGGHLNPAISLMLWIYRGFPFRKALMYITAQLVGAFLAGLIAYGVYKDAIKAYDAAGGQKGVGGGSVQAVDLVSGGTGKAFYTEPQSFVGAGVGFANEFVATAILSCAILALGDDSNAPPGAGMHALIVGLVVTVLGMAFGYNTGACLNPARGFGSRAAAAAVGYSGQVFTIRGGWWAYGSWGATISGSLVGAFFYDVAIFVGGESPVNYPRSRRKRARDNAKFKAKRRWWNLRRRVEKADS